MAAGSFKEICGYWQPKYLLSRALGEPDQQAVAWARRDFIPPEYWLDLIAAARMLKPRKRITLDELADLAAWRKRKRKKRKRTKGGAK